MLRKSFCVVVSVIVFSALAVAADMSGTWVLDKAKSDPIMMGRGGRGGEGGQAPNIDVTLVIKQTANDIAISRTMTRDGQDRTTEQKYTLDGKETTIEMGRGQMVARARMENDILLIEGTQKMSTPNGDFEIKLKESYSLSGDVLTVTSTRSTPNGERTSKQVYNKK